VIGINLFVVLLILFLVVFFIYAFNSGVKNPFQHYHLGFYPFLIFLYGLIRYKYSPWYFEAEISNESVKIKTIDPSKYYGLRFILLIFYRVKPTEFIIDRVSFTSYRIVIGKCGFNKRLILQKSVEGIYSNQNQYELIFWVTKSIRI
jgi:hypothetical protein